MAKIKVTQVKSKIGSTLRQRKMNATVEHEDTPEILGMVAKVRHLVSLEK